MTLEGKIGSLTKQTLDLYQALSQGQTGLNNRLERYASDFSRLQNRAEVFDYVAENFNQLKQIMQSIRQIREKKPHYMRFSLLITKPFKFEILEPDLDFYINHREPYFLDDKSPVFICRSQRVVVNGGVFVEEKGKVLATAHGDVECYLFCPVLVGDVYVDENIYLELPKIFKK